MDILFAHSNLFAERIKLCHGRGDNQRKENMTAKLKATRKSQRATPVEQQRGVRMPGPSASTVRSHLRRLRKMIDESKDPCEQRIAYGMETAIRWARQNTTRWGDMADEAKTLAELLRREIRAS